MLVRIDDDGIDLAESIVCLPCFGSEAVRQPEVAAIGRVGVNAEIVLVAKVENCR